jgi:peptide/nickel transport system permease protein
MAQISDAVLAGATPDALTGRKVNEAEIRYYTASQFQLMWWKFKKHRLALIGMIVLGFFIFIATFAEVLSPYDSLTRTPEYLYGPPQTLHFVDAEGVFHLRPFTNALTLGMDPATFKLVIKEDPGNPWPVKFFVHSNP